MSLKDRIIRLFARKPVQAGRADPDAAVRQPSHTQEPVGESMSICKHIVHDDGFVSHIRVRVRRD